MPQKWPQTGDNWSFTLIKVTFTLQIYGYQFTGIAKAIADAAGEKLNEECESIICKDGKIATGECCITNSGDLPCKKVNAFLIYPGFLI